MTPEQLYKKLQLDHAREINFLVKSIIQAIEKQVEGGKEMGEIILMPGPNSLYVLKTSISYGPKLAWCALLAVLLGDASLILLSYLLS